MIAEAGLAALWLAAALAALQLALALGAGGAGGRAIGTIRAVAVAQGVLTLAAFAALIAVFLRTDLSVLLVAENSHAAKPWLYKFAGAWGNHEGSMLLWVTVLAIAGAVVALFERHLDERTLSFSLAAQAALALGFFAFLLFASNPFERLNPAPLAGRGLNPLLQDPGLAFHPPTLYLGYVGLSVAFSLAVGALVTREVGPALARAMRPWVLGAWVLLTLGITAGSEDVEAVEQGGRREPRHQRSILDRVPEPPPAPAELIISPVTARSDAEREQYPRSQHPRLHGPRQCGADLARDQRSDREAERHRQPDIAKVKRRRMEGEAGILEQRVKSPAHERRWVEPLERVGGEQKEGEETQRKRGLRGEAEAQRALVDVAFEQSDNRPGNRQHGHPQQHRAFVIAPCPGELVQPRLGGVAVLGDQQHTQVGAQEKGDQRGEGGERQHPLRDRYPADRDDRPALLAAGPERQRKLQRRQRRGEPQRGKAGLGDHCGGLGTTPAICGGM